MSGEEISEKEIASMCRKFALLNSTNHEGKANLSSVIGRIFSERPDLKKHTKIIGGIASKEVRRVDLLSIDEQLEVLDHEFPGAREEDLERRKEISKKESEKPVGLPELPGAVQGAVVTRFPPEPNGFMHIGHAKAAIIGSEYAKKYSGQFVVRFDDTNPATERKEYYDAFLQAIAWLKIKADKIHNASDDMITFYRLAENLIRKDGAYVCTCSPEVIRANRVSRITCKCRSNSTERNLLLWNEMLERKRRKNEAVLRFVGDMQSVNTTMRDPVLFRIVEEPHPIQGTRYSVWPTYDFDGPIEDSLEGITHALRSKEYELRDELYHAILNALELRQPRIIEFSRLALRNTTVSKRGLRRLIEEGKVEGWDDPRLPTIFGLRRKGFLPEAIKQFVLTMGVSKVESEPTWDSLESINRKLLDPLTRRFFFVPEPVLLEIAESPSLEVRLKYHPDRDYGERMIQTDGRFMISGDDARRLKVGDRFRLIEAYNVEVIQIIENRIIGKRIEDKVSSGFSKLQWVKADDNLPFSVIETGPLLNGEKFNPESLFEVKGLAESSSVILKKGDIIQFVRFGFCRIDGKGMAILAHR